MVRPHSFTTHFIYSLSFATACIAASSVQAEVILNATGARLDGNISITAAMGETRGGNLFHSFNVFNVLSGESATFSGPGSINNVISRVTGGTSDITGLKASIFDGPVSLSIPNANFYFINPNGIIFGEYGSINATGSVYLGTADVVRFADGANFYADPAKSSILTTADPAAFGFLGDSPASLELNGPFINAPVPPGKTFALVAGDIDIRALTYGTAIIAPAATVSLSSVASTGDVALGGGPADLSGFAALGQIHLSGGSFIDVGDGPTGSGAGSIYIRGGQLTLSPAALLAQTFGDNDGGVIDIAVRGDMVVETRLLAPTVLAPSIIVVGSGSSGISGGGAIVGGLGAGPQLNLDVGGTLIVGNGSFITSESFGPGAAGDIHIRAGGIEIQGGGLGGEFTGITADNYGGAAGPSLTIMVGNLRVLNGGIVGTLNLGESSGGDLNITADSVLATGTGLDTLSLSTETHGGPAGNLSLNTRTLELRDGARISSSTAGFGDAGDVNIMATEQISNNGDFSGIFSSTVATDAAVGDAGNAGALYITTPLLLANGGVVDTTTVGDGDAGAIDVRVGDLQLTGGAQIRSFSGGFDRFTGELVVGSGSAGSVDVNATGDMNISGMSATGRPSGLLAETRGAGAGGDVNVHAWRLTVSDGAVISSSSLGSGLAGDVNIALGDSLQLRGGSITTQATESDGGNITITAPRLIHLADSRITTSVESGVGSGGNIFIDPQFVVLQNSQIVANAFGGPGGNINIIAGQFISDPATVISASSTLGIDGTVNIEAPDADLSADLAALPASFIDASRMMQAGCGAARAGLSSLVEVGRGGLPPAPDDYLPSLALDAVVTGNTTVQPHYETSVALPNVASPMRVAFAMTPKCGH